MARTAAFLAIFAASGFTGLIYESIWTHYIKLFLGHAAFAQTLVLGIFMGGMAIGAWAAGRLSAGRRDPIRDYAVVEAVIGLAALGFHPLFVWATELAFTRLLPGAGSPLLADAVKWGLGAALILPQSILLGATFPLMAAGFTRRLPGRQGGALAGLYFANSLGGAIGVLVTGFVLVGALGLPGTLGLAGAVNLAIAVAVMGLRGKAPAVPAAAAAAPGGGRLLVATAFLTGFSSFLYEVGWIRMLALVLGASTHSFELMLSAFILGLALGGLLVRRHIDRLAEPLRWLAGAQLAMGAAAIATLALYGQSFSAMAWLVQTLPADDAGWRNFNLASHALALAVMLPATICAGTTLPLITVALLKGGQGEGAIGRAYAGNTLGGICGVAAAVSVGLGTLGLKGIIVAAGAIDMAVGVVLLARVSGRGARLALAGAGAVTVAAVLAPGFDIHAMASGVYRAGNLLRPGQVEILDHRDGRTATVTMLQDRGLQDQGRVRSIRTNGKVDGSIAMAGAPTMDETTMIMAAMVPLALHPDARTVANIGFGTGLTTAALLGSRTVERVDTVEIEPAMVEIAKGFRPVIEAAYADPRSRIVIDDAKSYFSSHGKRYDIIVSEPSNPWVSGVAGLFSREFYRLVRRHLAEDGVLVQWIQAYEIDSPLVMSVVKALAAEFPDWQLYAATPFDLLVVARPSGSLLPRPGLDLFADPGLAQWLARTDARSMADIARRRLGGPAVFGRLAAATPLPANSDYAPVLDQGAARARFLRANATDLLTTVRFSLPLRDLLEGRDGAVVPTSLDQMSAPAVMALGLHAAVLGGARPALATAEQAGEAERILDLCRRGEGEAFVLKLGMAVGGLLPPPMAARLWAAAADLPCLAAAPPRTRQWAALFAAMGGRDAAAMGRHAMALLPEARGIQQAYLARVALLAERAQGGTAAWRDLPPVGERQLDLIGRVLAAP